MMIKFLSIFYIVDTIIFAAWFGLAFPYPTTTHEDAMEFQGKVDRIRCQSSSFIFTALLMFWKAILLVLGLYLSFLIRHVSADFQESMWIFASAMVVLVGSILVLPLAYLVDMAAAPFYIFLASSFLICTVVVMSLMLLPKVSRLNEAAQSSESTAKSRNRYGSSTIVPKSTKDLGTHYADSTTNSTHPEQNRKSTVGPDMTTTSHQFTTSGADTN